MPMQNLLLNNVTISSVASRIVAPERLRHTKQRYHPPAKIMPSPHYVVEGLIGLETIVVMFSSGRVTLPNAFSNSDRNALEVH